MGKNWKTSVGGLLIALGTGLETMEDANMKMVGKIFIGVGALLLGLMAKDKNVTGGTTQQ